MVFDFKINKLNISLGAIGAVAALLFFQNCGNIDIQRTFPSLDLKVKGIKGHFCLSNPNLVPNVNAEIPPAGNFNSLVKLYVLPITSVPSGNLLVADSDMDGLSDAKEQELSQYGYSDVNRRSHGIIDGICYRRNGNSSTSCAPIGCVVTKTYFGGGINNCDVDGFNGNADLKGLNMDSAALNTIDYMPDFIEALRGTSIASVDVDGTTNSDQDTVDNEAEIMQNSDPLVTESNANNTVYVDIHQDTESECAGQTSYSFTIPVFTTLPVKAFNDGSQISHAENENVGVIIVVSSNVQGVVQYQSYLLKVPYGKADFKLDIKPKDFKFEGSY